MESITISGAEEGRESTFGRKYLYIFVPTTGTGREG